ncbi:Rv3654c family TadE-like protein [Herbiconiux sp. YIM B11900]|uniref:Rv3654c family TadE-like protein n=1 Tax=Herbiconiux sp. YIM B11900 TaxID=3404131 RepID=UPI003F8796D4
MVRRFRNWRGLHSAWADENGSGSILGVGLVLALAVLVCALAPLGAALAGHQRLQGAADSAALAAADTASGRVAGFPCEAAGEVTASLAGSLVGCVVADGLATVVVSGEVGGIPLTASARAGPPAAPP